MNSSSHYYSQYNKKYIESGRKYVKDKSVKILLNQFMIDVDSEQGKYVLAVLKSKNCLYDKNYIDKDFQVPINYKPTCNICHSSGYKPWKLVGITTEDACRVIMQILPYIWCEKCFRKRFCYQDQNPFTCGIAVFPPTDYTSDKFKDVGSQYINKQNIPPNLIHSPKLAPHNPSNSLIRSNSSPPPLSKPGIQNSSVMMNLRSSNSEHNHIPLLSSSVAASRSSPHPPSSHPLLSSPMVSRPPVQNSLQPPKSTITVGSQVIPILNDPSHKGEVIYRPVVTPSREDNIHNHIKPQDKHSTSIASPVSPSQPQDIPQELPQDILQELPQSLQQDQPQEQQQEQSQEHSQEQSQEQQQDQQQEQPQEHSQEHSQEQSQEHSQEQPQEHSQEHSQEQSQEHSQDQQQEQQQEHSQEPSSVIPQSYPSDGLQNSLSSELQLFSREPSPDGVVLDTTPVEEDLSTITSTEQASSYSYMNEELAEEYTGQFMCYHKGFFKSWYSNFFVITTSSIAKYPNETRNEKKRKEIFLYDATFEHSKLYSDSKHPCCVIIQPGESSYVKRPFIICLYKEDSEQNFLTLLEEYARIARLTPPPTYDISQSDDSD